MNFLKLALVLTTSLAGAVGGLTEARNTPSNGQAQWYQIADAYDLHGGVYSNMPPEVQPSADHGSRQVYPPPSLPRNPEFAVISAKKCCLGLRDIIAAREDLPEDFAAKIEGLFDLMNSMYVRGLLL